MNRIAAIESEGGRPNQHCVYVTLADTGAVLLQGRTTLHHSVTRNMHLGPMGTGDAFGAATMLRVELALVYMNAVKARRKQTTCRGRVLIDPSVT